MSETDEVPVAEAALEARLADVSADAAALRVLLPAELQSLISDAVVRSHKLYEEFVDRLVLRVARETGLEAATREPASAAEVVVRLGLEPRRALVPIDWILRRLTARRTVEEVGAGRRFRSRGVRALPDAAPVREEQQRHDSSWLPSYTLAETVAQDYPAFLRGEIAGEEVLFAPRRLRLWVDYFSNANGQYAVSNHVGAIGVARWLPRAGGVILEVGGGLGSGAVAVLERLEAAGRIGDVRGYRFTELVPAFLRRGQQALEGRFRRPAWLRCDALDMNRPFGEQGVRPGDLAVVYAVNALHVAHDLAFTLGEVHRALAPGGELIVSECVRPHSGQTIYAEFIFNLMETFRAPRLHPVYRPMGGFLTAVEWRAAHPAPRVAGRRLVPHLLRGPRRGPAYFPARVRANPPRRAPRRAVPGRGPIPARHPP